MSAPIARVSASDDSNEIRCDYGNVSGLIEVARNHYVFGLVHYGNTCVKGRVKSGGLDYMLYIEPVPKYPGDHIPYPGRCVFSYYD